MPTTEYRFYMSVTSFCRKKDILLGTRFFQDGGSHLGPDGFTSITCDPGALREGGPFLDQVGSDFHGDRLILMFILY